MQGPMYITLRQEIEPIPMVTIHTIE